MEQKIDIAIIGECLIELSANGSLADTSTLNKFFGGDTVSTAVTVARLGGNVTYLTKVGNDGFSEFILSSLKKENIDTSLYFMLMSLAHTVATLVDKKNSILGAIYAGCAILEKTKSQEKFKQEKLYQLEKLEKYLLMYDN
jgi:sugar/nucleoside kinase (ribokinase family)